MSCRRFIKSELVDAYEKGNRRLVNKLIAKGGSFRGREGFRLVLENCKREEMGDLEFLLKNEAPLRFLGKTGSPLWTASTRGFTEKVRLLLKYLPDDMNHEIYSSFLSACMNNRHGVVRLFMEHGVEVNSSLFDKTPLMAACEGNHKEIVDVLIEQRANLIRKNQYGETCLFYAYENKNGNELVKYLIDKEPRLVHEETGLLIEAVKKNDLEMAKYFIEKKFDLNVTEEEHKTTALMIAVKKDNFKMVQLLIEHGAQLNLADIYGYTVLIISVENRNFEMAQFLINHGAKLDSADKSGYTALRTSVDEKNLEMAQLLVQNDAKIHFTSRVNNALTFKGDDDFYAFQFIEMIAHKRPELIRCSSRRESI